MILGFKQKFPDNTATNFKEKILSGTKIHSLRESDRFRAGMSIQMAYGVRTKYYEQFNKGIPALETCISKQKVSIHFIRDENRIIAIIDDTQAHSWKVDYLIKNDGLTRKQFIDWFFPNEEDEWNGFIIHWTDFKY